MQLETIDKIKIMNTSDWISLGALAVSLIALFFSKRNEVNQSKISFLEKRNSIRVNIHESTMEILLLIEKIKNQAKTEQEIRIIKKLIETAQGMTSAYEKLKENVEIPWYTSLSTFISEYNHIFTEMKEFNLILTKAKSDFDNKNIEELEMTVDGLHVRTLGSKGIE